MPDYRYLEIGTKIKRGEIKECPYCKRVGLVQEIGGKLFTTHIDGMALNQQKQPETVEDACPKEGVSFLLADHA
jgi:hypothetical protein